jgi:YggT family protein
VNVVSLVAGIVNLLLLLYVLVLLARMVLDWVPMFNREWRPRGFGLVLAEAVYIVTDPPIRLVRRFVKPVRIGAASIDFSFTVVLLACFVLLAVTRSFG